ncbi:MAG: IPT/TIG domain-containing protein [Deltaproteobacteria bacterium]|nr:IPT/TIG domain-containing protein [Deltaproteobacteria bacterium]
MFRNAIFLFVIIAAIGFTACDDDSTNSNNSNNNTNNSTNTTGDGPVIFSVIPNQGPAATGGTEVAVYGKNFEAGAQVFFGDNESSAPVVQSSGTILAVSPASTVTGAVDVRVVQENGEYTLPNAFTYTESTVEIPITWCIFQSPAQTSTVSGVSTELLFGRVFSEGTTNSPGKGAGISAQVGYGPQGSSPESDDWVWVSATYNMDADDGANDEYMGAITPVSTGDFDMAFRFNGGQGFVYCDINGTDDGYNTENAALLTVTDQTEPVVDWCIMQWPYSYTENATEAGPNVYGRVFMEGVTDAEGQGSGIAGQLGYGPLGTVPGVDPGWQWVDSDFLGDVDNGANDEFQTQLTIAQPGEYSYAYRFNVNDGPWRYCDANGSDDGYSPDQAGTATIEGESTATVDWCNLQYPASTAALAGNDTANFYGRVYVNGVTQGNGQGQGISGMIGYGPEGSDPETSTEWTWVDAVYNVSVDGSDDGDLSNDEYMASLNVTTSGIYSVAYKFSADGGTSWTYCDLDGSDNGISIEELGELEIYETQPEYVDWCIFQYPYAVETFAGGTTESLYGRVFVAGITEGAGQGPSITSQLGYAVAGTDPTVHPESFTWIDADYFTSVSGINDGDLANDEYVSTVTIDSTGVFSLVYRFSRDAGVSWTYCDYDGSGNGFDISMLPELTVSEAPEFSVQSVFPEYGTILGGTSLLITGTGFTDNATVKIGSEDCLNVNVVSSTEITCDTPVGSDFGYLDVNVYVDWGFETVVDGFAYRPVFTPNVDGNGSDWNSAFLVAENSVTTDWGSSNVLTSMNVSYDSTNLYILVNGGVESQNALMVLIDTDYGTGSGISDLGVLNDTNGTFDTAVSGSLVIDDASFGSEFVVGSIGNNTVTNDVSDMSGLRNLSNNGNLGWDNATLLWDGTVSMEIAIPLETFELDIPLANLAFAVVIGSSSGDAYSNQSLPEGISSGTLSAVATLDIQQ